MGRVVLTNVDSWRARLETVNQSAGFEESAHRCFSGHHAFVYKKLRVQNENYYEIGNDFIACNGTITYRDSFGKEALTRMLDDAASLSLRELRGNILGSGVIVIKRDDVIRVFADESQTYFLYYYVDQGSYLITNTWYHVEACVQSAVDPCSVVELGMRGGVLPPATVYKGIRRLSGNQYLEIDVVSGGCQVKDCKLNEYDFKIESKSELVDYIVGYLGYVASLRARFFSRNMLFLTGGVDSRLHLAADLAWGPETQIAYWMGSNVVTNGTSKDLEIARQLAQDNALRFSLFDVSEDYSSSLNNITKEKCDKYGEYSAVYAGNKLWFDIFESLDGIEELEFGYAGEALRELAALDRGYCRNYSISDFIRDVYDRGGIYKGYFDSPEAVSVLESKLLECVKSIDPEDLSLRDCYTMFSFSRLSCDCIISNLSNMFAYSFPALFQRPLLCAVEAIPYEWLAGSSIVAEVINEILPNALNVVFYSHHREHHYKGQSKTIKESLYYRLLDWSKSAFKDTRIYSGLYVNHLHTIIRPQSKVNDEIFSVCKGRLGSSKCLRRAGLRIREKDNWGNSDLSALASFVAVLSVCDLLEDMRDGDG